MQQIDVNSDVFQAELEKTWTFVDKVNVQFGFVLNPNEEVNDGVVMGLARNKLIYGKRYCPCFMVQGETKEEQLQADNRICPCKPALEVEIPTDGTCHCGIFCTPEFAEAQTKSDEIAEAVHQHSKGLSVEQAQMLLEIDQLGGNELEALIEARTLGMVKFTLVDTREYMEFQMKNIVGTDTLLPTSQFYNKIEPELGGKKSENIVLYCHSGSRSYQVQHAMKSMGYEKVSNLRPGIIGFRGETQRG